MSVFKKKTHNNPYDKPLRPGNGTLNVTDEVLSADFSEGAVEQGYQYGTAGAYMGSGHMAPRHFAHDSFEFREDTLVDDSNLERRVRMPKEAKNLWKLVESKVPAMLDEAGIRQVNSFMARADRWKVADQLSVLRALDRPLTRDEQQMRYRLEREIEMMKLDLTRRLRSE